MIHINETFEHDRESSIFPQRAKPDANIVAIPIILWHICHYLYIRQKYTKNKSIWKKKEALRKERVA